MNDQAVERAELSEDGPFMTITEVADYLDLHRITIYRLIKRAVNLGQFKVGNAWRFSRDDIIRFGRSAGQMRNLTGARRSVSNYLSAKEKEQRIRWAS